MDWKNRTATYLYITGRNENLIAFIFTAEAIATSVVCKLQSLHVYPFHHSRL
jgi:hypothetical protein